MKELIDSLREQVRERANSPVFGSFAIAWICWNHQYLVVLLSSMPIPERLAFAVKTLYEAPFGLPPFCGIIFKGILWPALSCIGYLIIYPHISKILVSYWDRQQADLANLRKQAQKKEVLTREEAETLFASHLHEREKLKAQLASQTDDIMVLRQTEKGLKDKLATATDRITELEKSLEQRHSADQAELKKLVALLLRKGSVTEQAVASALKMSEFRGGRLLIKALTEQLVVIEGEDEFKRTKYGLSEPGRNFAVAHDLDSTPANAGENGPAARGT